MRTIAVFWIITAAYSHNSEAAKTVAQNAGIVAALLFVLILFTACAIRIRQSKLRIVKPSQNIESAETVRTLSVSVETSMNANYALETVTAESIQIPSINSVVVNMQGSPNNSEVRCFTFSDDHKDEDDK